MPTASSPAAVVRSESDVRVTPIVMLEFEDSSLVVDRDTIRIGSGPMCEIRLPDGPILHSVIRTEAGVVWVEAHDDANLMVNWRACRRMALRDGDVILAAGQDITVRHQLPSTIENDAASLASEISQLTAEQLCDRILAEQSAVEEFESNRLKGWQKLMMAMKEVVEAEQPDGIPAVEFSNDGERLLEQIREMSEMMNGRTQELDICESELIAATTLLQETQDRVSRQIEDLLDQIGESSRPSELRAIA